MKKNYVADNMLKDDIGFIKVMTEAEVRMDLMLLFTMEDEWP